MSNMILIFVLTATSLSISACEDNSSDTADESATDADTDLDSEEGETPVGVARFAGSYQGLLTGNGYALIAMVVDNQGKFEMSNGSYSDPNANHASGEIDETGHAGFITDGIDVVDGSDLTVSYEGTFRFEGENVYAFGEAVASNGEEAVWGLWREDNTLPITLAETQAICARWNDVCGEDNGCPQADIDDGGVLCQVEYAAAKSAQCRDSLMDYLAEVEAMSAAECDTLSGNPVDWVGWEENGCPDISYCLPSVSEK